MKKGNSFQIIDLSIDKINDSTKACFLILGFIPNLAGNYLVISYYR